MIEPRICIFAHRLFEDGNADDLHDITTPAEREKRCDELSKQGYEVYSGPAESDTRPKSVDGPAPPHWKQACGVAFSDTGTPDVQPPPWRVRATGTSYWNVVDENGVMVCSAVTREIAEFIARCREFASILGDANELCRSAYSIAERDGVNTSWASFRKRLKESLDRQHAIMHPLADPLLGPTSTVNSRHIVCPQCNGAKRVVVGPPLGSADGPQYDTCPTCDGKGIVEKDQVLPQEKPGGEWLLSPN